MNTMNKTISRINFEELAGGAFSEKLNEALAQVAENIQNPNTDAAAKRAVNITIKFAPNKTRQIVNTQISVTTKLAATEAIDTQMVMGVNMRTGQVEIAEYDGQIQGQMSMEFPKSYEYQEKQPSDGEDAPQTDPTDAPQEPQMQGRPLDLRLRANFQRRRESAQAAATGRAAGFDPETGEIYEDDRRTEDGHTGDKVVNIKHKAGQA